MIDKERLQLGLDALRSGNYQQARGSLCKVDTYGVRTYCCLGVLIDVAIKNGLDTVTEYVAHNGVAYVDPENVGRATREWTLLPKSVQDWYGFDSHGPSVTNEDHEYPAELTQLNDEEHRDFAYIADAIEATFMREES